MRLPQILDSLSRRQLLTAGAVGAGALWLGGEARGDGASSDEAAADEPLYPTTPPDLAREVVGAAHGRFERLRELVDPRPELARSSWDWGYGDWESALGAASHVGRSDIAEYLIERGARPNIFSAAMLGQLGVVRAFVELDPTLPSLPGPHGIPLLAHARAGGDRAGKVVQYLEGRAGTGGSSGRELTGEEISIYRGEYRYGPGPSQRFEVAESSLGGIALARVGGTPRRLQPVGSHEFHPPGAPSVRVRFEVREGSATELSIWHPGRVVTARRIAAAD